MAGEKLGLRYKNSLPQTSDLQRRRPNVGVLLSAFVCPVKCLLFSISSGWLICSLSFTALSFTALSFNCIQPSRLTFDHSPLTFYSFQLLSLHLLSCFTFSPSHLPNFSIRVYLWLIDTLTQNLNQKNRLIPRIFDTDNALFSDGGRHALV
jgi:hypothetical protein